MIHNTASLALLARSEHVVVKLSFVETGTPVYLYIFTTGITTLLHVHISRAPFPPKKQQQQTNKQQQQQNP